MSPNEILRAQAAAGNRGVENGSGLPGRGARLDVRLKAALLTPVLFVATLAIGWLIWSAVEWCRGRTPSYRLTGLRVVRRSDGLPIGPLRSLVREVICLVLLVPTILACLVLALSFVMGASPPDGLLRQPRRAPWDLLTGTTVVHERRHRRKPKLRLGGDWPADPSAAETTPRRDDHRWCQN